MAKGKDGDGAAAEPAKPRKPRKSAKKVCRVFEVRTDDVGGPDLLKAVYDAKGKNPKADAERWILTAGNAGIPHEIHWVIPGHMTVKSETIERRGLEIG
jgi:hypothetical protein